MIDKNFYKGFEGEDQVKIWTIHNNEEIGFLLWAGYFELLLDGCTKAKYEKEGLIECYFQRNGFYDDKWEAKDLSIIVEELKQYDENQLRCRDPKLKKDVKTIADTLLYFIDNVVCHQTKLYIEYI